MYFNVWNVFEVSFNGIQIEIELRDEVVTQVGLLDDTAEKKFCRNFLMRELDGNESRKRGES